MNHPVKTAVLLSGGGRTLENLACLVEAGELPISIELVIATSPEAFGLTRAENHGLPTAVIDGERRLEPEAYSASIFAAVEDTHCELVILAGFLRFLPIPGPWLGRVINIHPALLPAFGGKGFYGDRVHRAVLERGVQFTGCTVHYADNVYDNGPIILQRCIEVAPDDTADTLAARVFEEEKLALPEAIRIHVAGLGN